MHNKVYLQLKREMYPKRYQPLFLQILAKQLEWLHLHYLIH